jgi:hypothetical protein
MGWSRFMSVAMMLVALVLLCTDKYDDGVALIAWGVLTGCAFIISSICDAVREIKRVREE